MRLLVTGGAGFIGSNYVRHVLAASDDAVTVYDALTYAGNLDNLRDVESDSRYRFVKGDITDRGAVEEAMAGHDAVVHFAAESHVDRSIVSPDEFVHTNCDGTNVIMDIARRVGVERVVHISTDEVYGSIAEGSFHETDRLDPRSPYSASKAGSDLIARSYFTTYGLPVIITRSSNNFGPYQYPEKVIPLFVTNLLDGRPVPLYGDGMNVRDWIHVEDHCLAIWHVLGLPEADGRVWNVSAENEVPNRVVTDTILRLVGRSPDLVRYVTDRPGHDRRYALDSTALRATGWRPRRSFDDGLAATVEWYQTQRSWWEAVKSGAYRSYYEAMYGERLRGPRA